MNDKRLPPLSSLQAFEAAARHESFLNAAAEQDVASGSINRRVRLLERYLGTELFVRRSNGVALTAAGQQYAGTVNAILRDLRAATDRVRKPPLALYKGVIQAAVDGMGMAVGHGEMVARELAAAGRAVAASSRE